MLYQPLWRTRIIALGVVAIRSVSTWNLAPSADRTAETGAAPSSPETGAAPPTPTARQRLPQLLVADEK
ncbi:hypothetical protein IU486_28670 [Streptomyces gardneri]|nr:hypothetical protein [Streptomyces gardneri]MBF6208628.1 hypothetical protein [Streptomyces gardneri]